MENRIPGGNPRNQISSFIHQYFDQDCPFFIGIEACHAFRGHLVKGDVTYGTNKERRV